MSDIYQDLTGEGSYHGKGIYDLQAFHRVLSGRFPEAHLLSHDLIEGAHVRVGLATDIELLDVFPSSYIAWWNRQHRWIRGDWQIIDWLKMRVPAFGGGSDPNPLSVFNRWKIFDNLRRSLVPPALVALLISGWLFTPAPALWSLLVAGLLLWPVFASLLAPLLHPPPPGTRIWREPWDRLLRSFFTAVFLVDYAGMSIEAIARTVLAAADFAPAPPRVGDRAGCPPAREEPAAAIHPQRLWIPAVSALLLTGTLLLGSGDGGASWPFLLLWAFSPLAVALINRPAIERRGGNPDRRRSPDVRGTARRTWRYFDDFVGPQTHWLPPDNFQEAPARELFLRTSPTNIGLWMLATVAANDFGYITLDDVAARNLATLETLDKLERFEGHLLNWYDISNLEPLRPRYVSTVDSGNLVGSLWALRCGASGTAVAARARPFRTPRAGRHA